MTTYDTKHIAVVDPRTFDGDPFTVAHRAAEQAAALVELSADQTKLAALMARNSSMERDLQAGDDANPAGWEDGPYGKAFVRIEAELRSLVKRLHAQAAAAGYDPKHPPKA